MECRVARPGEAWLVQAQPSNPLRRNTRSRRSGASRAKSRDLAQAAGVIAWPDACCSCCRLSLAFSSLRDPSTPNHVCALACTPLPVAVAAQQLQRLQPDPGSSLTAPRPHGHGPAGRPKGAYGGTQSQPLQPLQLLHLLKPLQSLQPLHRYHPATAIHRAAGRNKRNRAQRHGDCAPRGHDVVAQRTQ